MNDFYGKRNLSDLSARLKCRANLVAQDLGHLGLAASKRPFVIPAVSLLLLSFLSYLFCSVLPALLICLLTLAVSIILFSRSKQLSALLIGILLCCAFLYCGFFISKRLNATADTGGDTFNCTVTDLSRELSGETNFTIRLDGGAYAVLKYYGTEPYFDRLGSGDRMIVTGKLKVPEKAGNPGEFDYSEYLRKKGVRYILNCQSLEFSEKASFPLGISGSIKEFFFRLRLKVITVVGAAFDGDSKALLSAVCLGDKSLISDEVRRDFQMSCCSHLLAVSGTHFSGFMVCLPVFLNALRLKRRRAFLVHVIFCLLIGCFTGWSDSVTRAAIMSICVFAERDWLSALSLASAVMTLADPFCPLSSGFQMSFCAVLGIKVYSSKISSVFMKLHQNESISDALSVTISAGLGMIPFWSDISMRPDILHLLIQLIGSLLAGAACTCFVPCVLLCMLFPFWSGVLSAPLSLCLNALRRLVSWGCSLSEKGSAPIHLPKNFLILLAVVVFLFFIPPCMLKRLLLKLTALILAVAAGFVIFDGFKHTDCRVIFADVGQGDCCLIMTPDKTCLIDAGTYEEGASTVVDLLDYYGIYQVDYCIMSHWDVDHAGGIAALSEMGRTKAILTSYVPKENDLNADVLDFYKSTRLKDSSRQAFMSQLNYVTAGDRITLSDSVYIDVLAPASSTGAGNENSIVAMLNINAGEDTKILFTGDVGSLTETHLIEEKTDLDCDILKVAHHGSKYSSTEAFIAASSPSIAVISVGANNFYGHPAPATLERLESYGCNVFRTDQEGAVVLEY